VPATLQEEVGSNQSAGTSSRLIRHAADRLRHHGRTLQSPRSDRARGCIGRGSICGNRMKPGSTLIYSVASVRVIITGAQGFHRQVAFAADEEPAASTEMVRTTLDDE
jgi:hypothetical protein